MADDFGGLTPEQLLALGQQYAVPKQAPTDRAPTRITISPADISKMTAEQLLELQRQQQGPSLGERTEDIVRSFGPGVTRGAAALMGVPEMAARGIGATVEAGAPLFGVEPPVPGADISKKLPSAEKYLSDYEKLTGKLYEPKYATGEASRTAGEFLPGMAIGPVGRAGYVRDFIRWLGPALASEAGGQTARLATGQRDTGLETGLRFGGALAGGVMLHPFTGPRSVPQTIRDALPPGLTREHINAAGQLMQDGMALGVQLTWPEALSQVMGRPVLTNLMRHVEAVDPRGRMGAFFGARPEQTRTAAQGVFQTVAPQRGDPYAIGPQVGAAAMEEGTAVRQAINAATEPAYTASARAQLTPAQFAELQALPGYEGAARAIRADPQLFRNVAGMPEDSVAWADAIKKYLSEHADTANLMQQPTQTVAAGMRSDAARARALATQTSPMYEFAVQEQARLRQQYLEPLLQGPLGKLMKEDLTTQQAVQALFPANPLDASAPRIADAVARLAARNPEAARQLVRQHLAMSFNEASQGLSTGVGFSQAGGAKFRAQVFGNPQQQANLRAAVEALPGGQDIWPGIERFMQIMEASGARQHVGSRTAYNELFLKGQGMSGVVGETTKAVFNPLQGFQNLVEKYNQWRTGANLDELAQLFTDPRARNTLQRIARMPESSAERGGLVVARLLSLLEGASVTPRLEPRP